MSHTKIIIAIIFVLILGCIGYFAFTQTAAAPQEAVMTPSTTGTMDADHDEGTAMTGPVMTVAGGQATTITYTDAGFSPKTVSVKLGDTVTFVNNSSHDMWVASDAHPTHTDYDGTNTMQHCSKGANTNGTFDECNPAPSGTKYSFTFKKAGTFEYHNHVRASDSGSVTVAN
ncbi:MAG: hypothetical protein AB203_02025 [Parcubacteria bacterium C7867-008]|nr:MAG: hypothetical protein AB203_02025 [Parcubacteria bacterium C7867-008]